MSGRKDRAPRGKSYFPYAVAIGLAVILVGLAWLQYQWSNQVSQAERDRMEASLRIATTQFRQDFTREFQTLAAGLQPGPDLLAAKDWDAYASQSAEWLKNSNYPELVSGVYLWRPGQPLVQLDRAAKTWVPAAALEALEPVLRRIPAPSENPRQGRGLRGLAWTMDGNVPALFHGLLLFGDPEARPPEARPSDTRERDRPPPPTLAGFTMLLLSRDFLQTKLLPELAARHFGGPDGFVYQVGVYAGNDGKQALYRSGPNFTEREIASADVAVDLLETRPRPGDRQLGGPPPDAPPNGGFRKRNPGMGFQPGFGPAGNGFAFQERLRLARRLGVNTPAPAIAADARSSWKLVVRHPAGSVSAAVNGLRLRNLAVSFAILLLLAAAMALIMVTTQRAQRLARLQVEFVAGVSHELRTPLAVISSAAENLTDGIVSDKEQVKLYGSLIRKESRRLGDMMENILAFAAGGNRRAYEPRTISVQESIERALSFSAAAIAEANVTVETHIEPGLPPVLIEENGLLQCLQNLISNAVKYGGESRWMSVAARAEAGSVVISVADRGLGIEARDLPYVFDAFYRGRAATESQIHGTGLGLSLAKSFVEAAGGSISVKSAAGEGSCFQVRLPAVKALVERAPALAERAT